MEKKDEEIKPLIGDEAGDLGSLFGEKPVETPDGEKTEKEEAPVESVDENKVPYSRFKKFHDKALQAEQEAEKWRAEAERLRYQQPPKTETTEIPSEWKELYGDSEASMKAYKLEMRREEALESRLKQSAVEAYRESLREEAEHQEENESEIETNFEALSSHIGRNLTSKEQEALLDIVDEFTPTGEDGKYLGAILPFDKAWEIYEMKNNLANAPKKSSRDAVASLSGSQTQGNPDSDEVKNFQPGSWGNWRNKF